MQQKQTKEFFANHLYPLGFKWRKVLSSLNLYPKEKLDRFVEYSYPFFLDKGTQEQIQKFLDRGYIIGRWPNGVYMLPNDWDGPMLYGDNYEAWHTLSEIITGQYDFYKEILKIEPNQCVCIDIGANIGISALHFANSGCFEHVYAFEPIKPTLKQMRRNLRANPELAKKITLHSFGLAGWDHTVKVPYDAEHTGTTRTIGVNYPPPQIPQKQRLERAVLKDADRIIEAIMQKHPKKPPFVKMDVEGAEIEILSRLSATGLLNRIPAIALEWHDNNADEVEAILTLHNFKTCFKGFGENGSGMLWVINNNMATPGKGKVPLANEKQSD